MDFGDARARIAAALASDDPTAALERVARALKSEGAGQRDVYRLFSECQAALSGDDPRYDAVVDVMDLIWGGPWAKGRDIFDRCLGEEPAD
jgi:hypothetical protein